jgi:hypothetical protein
MAIRISRYLEVRWQDIRPDPARAIYLRVSQKPAFLCLKFRVVTARNNLQRSVILPVSIGFEAWSLTLRVEHRLRVFENMVMRKILGSKTRRQKNGEDHITRSFMVYTPHRILFGVIKLRRMKLTGNVARMGDRRDAYRVLVGRPDGNRPLGRPRCCFLPQVFLFCIVSAWRPWGVRRYYEPTDLSSANMSHTDHCANQHCSVAVVVNTEFYTFTCLID